MGGSCAARVVVGLSNMFVRWPPDLRNPLAMFSLPSETEAAAPEVAARTTELALRVLQSPKLKADAERFR